MKHNNIPTVQQIKESHQPIKNINTQHKEKLTTINKMALWITNKVGSMGFFFIIFIWTTLWLTFNTIAPQNLRFDPYPAFVLWLFISNMIQIFLMPLIMIGQNLQAKHSELRAEQDFKINIKAEAEIQTILMHLENQNEMILKILQKIDAKSN